MPFCMYRMNEDRLTPCQQPRYYGGSSVIRFIGFKGSVGGRLSQLWLRSTVKLQLILGVLSTVEAGGIRGVAVKCLDITKNSDCEGSLLDCN